MRELKAKNEAPAPKPPLSQEEIIDAKLSERQRKLEEMLGSKDIVGFLGVVNEGYMDGKAKIRKNWMKNGQMSRYFQWSDGKKTVREHAGGQLVGNLIGGLTEEGKAYEKIRTSEERDKHTIIIADFEMSWYTEKGEKGSSSYRSYEHELHIFIDESLDAIVSPINSWGGVSEESRQDSVQISTNDWEEKLGDLIYKILEDPETTHKYYASPNTDYTGM